MQAAPEMKADIGPILDKHPDAKRDSLIPILQEVQEAHGYVSHDAIVGIGRHLKPVSV